MSCDRECINKSEKDPCEGEVRYHASRAGTGTMIPRCQKHYDESTKRIMKIERRYPGSVRW